jgi:excisionase family DNA binding protein
MDNNECYTIEEVTNLLKISRQYLLNLRKEGKIKTIKIGSKVLIKRTEVERILKENEM